MGKSSERCFYTLDLNDPTKKQQKYTLTKKQMAVYTYLLANSNWNANEKEDHYYIYLNRTGFVKEMCKQLGISDTTWRNALIKLEEEDLIIPQITQMELQEAEERKQESGDAAANEYLMKVKRNYITIKIPPLFASLSKNLISYLLMVSQHIKNGENLVAVYAVLYRYFTKCKYNEQSPSFTIGQLIKLFEAKRTQEISVRYRTMLGFFIVQGLVKVKQYKKKECGKEYILYEITEMSNDFSGMYDGPEDISKILEAIQTEVEG